MKKLLSKLPHLLAIVFLAIAINYCAKHEPKELPQKPLKYEADIGKDVAPHVVPYRRELNNFSRGATGFYLNFHGKYYILTNKHVCEDPFKASEKLIIFGSYVGEIVAIDKEHDLCLVTSNRQSGLILADEMPPKFEQIYLVGFPRGLAKTIRAGHVVDKVDIRAPWLGGVVPTYMISTTAYGGNSGSPVVNKYGEVIGVLFAGSRVYHTEGYIVPLENVRAFLYEAIFGLQR